MKRNFSQILFESARAIALVAVSAGAILSPKTAAAYDNRCGNYKEGDTRSVCAGKSLPANQTRGRSDSRLTCSGSVDHFVRKPQEIPDYGAWQALITGEGSRSQKAFELRQQQPAIAWSGQIPYSTVEEWEWISCELGTSASECGTDRVCRTEYYTTTVQDCDANNNCTSRQVSESREVCDDVARTCYFDVRKSASMSCSSELITYDARFNRDSKWNPKHPEYSEFIPNKYDLLPGEVEMVQVFNGSGTTMTPRVEIGSAWNQYAMSININGNRGSMSCRQNAKNHMTVQVDTVKRLIKASPNAFQMPVDQNGRPLRALEWTSDTESGDKVRPVRMKLTDSSAALVRLMAQQSQNNADRERTKRELGLGESKDQMNIVSSKGASDFYKNTVLKFQLTEDKWWGTSSFTKPRFIRDADAVTLGNLRLSKIQALRNSDYWDIPLNDSELGANIYSYDKFLPRMLGAGERGLKPNQRYIIQLSMYQQGVPFYLQICTDEQKKQGLPNCAKSEKDVYSKPMELPFGTSKYDGRSVLQIVNEFTLVDWLHRKFRDKKNEN